MLDADKSETDAKNFRELIVQHRRALIASFAFMFMMIVSNQVEEEVIIRSKYLNPANSRDQNIVHVYEHIIPAFFIPVALLADLFETAKFQFLLDCCSVGAGAICGY